MSDLDTRYNCVAYAAGETKRKWWPVFHPDFYWPSAAPRINSIPSFVVAFQTLGYVECADGSFETGFEKVDRRRMGEARKGLRRRRNGDKRLGAAWRVVHVPRRLDSNHEAANLALFFLNEPEEKMLSSLEQTRSNLEAEIATILGAELAAAIAEAFVGAVAGHRREMESMTGKSGQA